MTNNHEFKFSSLKGSYKLQKQPLQPLFLGYASPGPNPFQTLPNSARHS